MMILIWLPDVLLENTLFAPKARKKWIHKTSILQAMMMRFSTPEFYWPLYYAKKCSVGRFLKIDPFGHLEKNPLRNPGSPRAGGRMDANSILQCERPNFLYENQKNITLI